MQLYFKDSLVASEFGLLLHHSIHSSVALPLPFLQLFERETRREKILEGRRRELKLKAKQQSAAVATGGGGGGG